MIKGSASGVAAALLMAGLLGCADRAAGPAAAAGVEAPLTRLAQDAALQWAPCPAIFPAGCEIAVLHGDPAQPNADVFLRAPGGGYRLPAHTHTSAEQMMLAAGELAVHYQGAEATMLTAGEYAYGPAGLPHEATCVSAEPCVLFIAFEGPVDATPFEGELE
ncbi:MAG TPA: cupin domain-containing protein [Vitreimonas sp.]|uniref:cupin domain-containing protein n=1 Tax=Vitreimonas sp. TaxID=3069702 RepID=UPI002D51F245|nr:cupin domain-containing protein [Vitreimonas sp.]HYD88618.1 cupin domain-containing protein [Vitreimonas sp.]